MSLGNQVRVMNLSSGLRTEFGTLLPPGVQVAAYVRSTGPQSGDDQDIRQRLLPTLNQALARCRSGAGDVVYVLPNHVENISTADQMSSLVAGTKIFGCGSGVTRPTFTWTAAAATFLLDVADVEINNCILNMDPGAGTVNVAAPITVSAAGCTLKGCQIRMGTDANSKVTIGITTTAAGDDLTFVDCDIYGATAAGCTTMLQFVGADRLKMFNTSVVGATTAVGVGVVRFLTTASTFIQLDGCKFQNNVASSTAAVTGMAGMSGSVDNTVLTITLNTAGNAAWSTATAGISFGGNVYVNNDPAKATAASAARFAVLTLG